MTRLDRDRLLAVFALGLSRQPLPALAGMGTVPPLAALALAGQGLRLTLPGPPGTPERGWRLPDDPLPPLPERSRTVLLRLVDKMDALTARALASPLLAHIAASGHRLHPFDYPRLGALLNGAAPLRPAERAWLDRGAQPPDMPPTAENWPDAPLAHRLRFLAALRTQDPTGARSLLEQGFAAETAKARADLLAVLGTGLGVADRPFLLACASDRGAGVRQVADDLLARLPGSDAAVARLAAAAACFLPSPTSPPHRLVFKPPSGPAVTPLQHLDQVGLAELAASLGLAPQDLPDRTDGDPLRLALAACALRDGNTGAATAFFTQMETVLWPGDLAALGAAFSGLPSPARHGFAAHVLRPGDAFGIGGDWQRFCIQLGSPLELATAQTLLASEGWRTFIARLDDRLADAALLPVAVLMPPALAAAFGASLAPLPAERRPRTTVLLAFLAELASLPPIDGIAP